MPRKTRTARNLPETPETPETLNVSATPETDHPIDHGIDATPETPETDATPEDFKPDARLVKLGQYAVGTFLKPGVIVRYLKLGQMAFDYITSQENVAGGKSTILKNVAGYVMSLGVPSGESRPDLWIGAYVAATLLTGEDDASDMTDRAICSLPWGTLRRFDSFVNWDSTGHREWKDRTIDDGKGNAYHVAELARSVADNRWSAERLGDLLKLDSDRRDRNTRAEMTPNARIMAENVKLASAIKGTLKRLELESVDPAELAGRLINSGVISVPAPDPVKTFVAACHDGSVSPMAESLYASMSRSDFISLISAMKSAYAADNVAVAG